MKIPTSKPVSGRLYSALQELREALQAENQSSDFAFTVMLQGYVVAASNLNDGSIMPTLKASFYASGDWKPGLK
jgi:DNA-binding winged helix-turn-helix (wHTH) protein